MAASCSACSSGKSLEWVRTKPSEETTTACSTPRTSWTNRSMSQEKFSTLSFTDSVIAGAYLSCLERVSSSLKFG